MNYVIGIDFGTSNSCISYYNTSTKSVSIIPNEQGNLTSPSVLFLDMDSSEILFSDVAMGLLLSNNKEYLKNIFNNLKRLIGKDDIGDELGIFFKYNKYMINDNEIKFEVMYDNKVRDLSVKDLVILYLKYLKNLICMNIGCELDVILDVVITVPAYFDDKQRSLMKDYCEKINLNVLRVINEPTAASLAYALDKYRNDRMEEEFIMTFDCGGGTTDISLLYLDYVESVYEVKSTVGDNLLGGEDITMNIMNFMIKKLGIEEEVKVKRLNKIRRYAEDLKRQLSFNEEAKIYLELGDNDYVLMMTRSEFNEINKEFYNKVKNLVYYLLDGYMQKEKDFTYDKINSIIFVGGTSRIPYFKELFEDIFAGAIINNKIDPDQTISIGASIQGALLKNLIDEEDGGDAILMDIVPLSIGIETMGGIMAPIISRNSLLPVSRESIFTNSEGYEESIEINIYQGERKFVKDNIYLGTFKLESPMLSSYDKGELKIKVIFNVDVDSIIHARAVVSVNGEDIESAMEVKKIFGVKMDDKNLNDILYSAEMNRLMDNELSNKILKKMELYDSFKYLLSIFHEKREEREWDEVLLMELNVLFNDTFNVINNYEGYSVDDLNKVKEIFERRWHALLFVDDIILTGEDGEEIEFGGNIID